MRRFRSGLCQLALGAMLVFGASGSMAANGDCGQPASLGAAPSVSDALTILRAGVGQATVCAAMPCVCDVNCDGEINVSDALPALKKAVGIFLELGCCCEGCTSASFELRAGSELDHGWTGVAHGKDLGTAMPTTVRVLRRCAGSGAACERDDDCDGQRCVATCNCGTDTSCEVTGPTNPKRCRRDLKTCSSNADCGAGACIDPAGPPLPLSSGGTPICIVGHHVDPLTGTVDSSSGTASLSANLLLRVALGITVDKPCPRCGAPEDDPQLGDMFNCSGGQFENAPCTVHGVTAAFGGTSFDCPPKQDLDTGGPGSSIRIGELTTGTTTRTAQLPCADTAFRENPSLPLDKCIGGSAAGAACTSDAQCPGGGTCNIPTCVGTTDTCTSNADCKRCTEDPSIDCSANAGACTGNGVCAEAPEQPVTCGHWCHCGFCNGNASRPCFETTDCPAGETCQMGPGAGNAANVPQRKPNDCAHDDFICGENEQEHCATAPIGVCSEQSYRSCTGGSNTCEILDAGECLVSARPCFEPRITRSGEASPLASYCSLERRLCSSNADCTGHQHDFCESDASRPQLAALFCVPGTWNTGINIVGGITGPVAIRLNALVKVCYCGDAILGCDEQCDDGNLNAGDGCDDLCRQE